MSDVIDFLLIFQCYFFLMILVITYIYRTLDNFKILELCYNSLLQNNTPS